MEQVDILGFVLLALFVVGVGVAITAAQKKRYARRRALLLMKYGDLALVERLMNRVFWQGETAEQLFDSLGKPADVDQKVLKTKKREIWKYHQTGTNRFGLRITLDNDIVVGWDQKD